MKFKKEERDRTGKTEQLKDTQEKNAAVGQMKDM